MKHQIKDIINIMGNKTSTFLHRELDMDIEREIDFVLPKINIKEIPINKNAIYVLRDLIDDPPNYFARSVVNS
jgi:hypothetical protein